MSREQLRGWTVIEIVKRTHLDKTAVTTSVRITEASWSCVNK